MSQKVLGEQRIFDRASSPRSWMVRWSAASRHWPVSLRWITPEMIARDGDDPDRLERRPAYWVTMMFLAADPHLSEGCKVIRCGAICCQCHWASLSGREILSRMRGSSIRGTNDRGRKGAIVSIGGADP